jgi:hypothetical protein
MKDSQQCKHLILLVGLLGVEPGTNGTTPTFPSISLGQWVRFWVKNHTALVTESLMHDDLAGPAPDCHTGYLCPRELILQLKATPAFD